MNRCLLFLLLMLLLCLPAAAEPIAPMEEIVYGASEMGRPLTCYRVGDADAAQSLLIIFGVHGFEDSYDHDGEILKAIAHNVLAHYSENPAALGGFALYVIPSANPDGLIDGVSQDGFGRCNANGLDVNRDFPIGWKKRTGARNQTGDAPFSTAEARAIRDLVESIAPTYAIDVHGWIHAAYGTGRMAKVFAKPFGFTVKQASSGGLLSNWLATVTEEAIMLEMPRRPDNGDYIANNSARLIEGINSWIAACTQP